MGVYWGSYILTFKSDSVLQCYLDFSVCDLEKEKETAGIRLMIGYIYHICNKKAEHKSDPISFLCLLFQYTYWVMVMLLPSQKVEGHLRSGGID